MALTPTPHPSLIDGCRRAGLSPLDVARLLALRWRIAAGEVHEETLEHRRLVFARQLATSGRIRG